MNKPSKKSDYKGSQKLNIWVKITAIMASICVVVGFAAGIGKSLLAQSFELQRISGKLSELEYKVDYLEHENSKLKETNQQLLGELRHLQGRLDEHFSSRSNSLPDIRGESRAQIKTDEPNDTPPSSNKPSSDDDLDNIMIKWIKGLIDPYYKLALMNDPNLNGKLMIIFNVNNENKISGLYIVESHGKLSELKKRLQETLPSSVLPIDARGYPFKKDIYLNPNNYSQ